MYVIAFSLFSFYLIAYLSNLLICRSTFRDTSSWASSTLLIIVTCFMLTYYCLFSGLFTVPAGQFVGFLTEGVSYLAWPFIYVFLVITGISFIFCFVFNFNEVLGFTTYLTVITLLGLVLFSTNSLVVFFLAYESLLVPSFLILYKYSKTRKSVEAAFLMFFWTQFGAMYLIFSIQYLIFIGNSWTFDGLSAIQFSRIELTLLSVALLVGFGVKFPIWPFYEWLPKAHVEASTNFSIFLSGVLVKFAFFGFIKFFSLIGIDLKLSFLKAFLLFGMIESCGKLYFQYDLKKLIAYSTVFEMHWLALAVISGQTFMFVAAFAMLISHALLSSSFFLLIDYVTRRLKSRLMTEVGGIFFLFPQLYTFLILSIITFLGFPGSLFFVAEFLFFGLLLDQGFGYFIITFSLVYLIAPSFFFKNWFIISFGSPVHAMQRAHLPDIDTSETLLVLFMLVNLYALGLGFQFFF